MIRALLVVVMLSAAVAAPSRAQDTDARALFEQANTALSTGRFAAARDLFRQSLAARESPATAFNLAVALRGTGETIASVEVFDRLLADDYGALRPGQRDEARRLRTETLAEVAVLHVSVSGAEGAEVRVDGHRTGTLSPDEALEWQVDAGHHVIMASAPRHETVEERVTVDRGASLRVALALEPTAENRFGTLVVEAADPEDVLEIVGVARGSGILRRELEPDDYEIQVAGPSGRRRSTVTVVAGDTLRVRLDVEQSSPFVSPWFWAGTGLGVAALVVAGILLFSSTEDAPVSDPVYGVITTLR